MSIITPPGGWDALPPQRQPQAPIGQNANQLPQYVYLARPQSSSAYLQCKICDRGVLTSKTIFRMSAPVVAIGFILLIPSIVGMALSALMVFGMFSMGGNAAIRVRNEAVAHMRDNYVP